jgi:hypothetical protein
MEPPVPQLAGNALCENEEPPSWIKCSLLNATAVILGSVILFTVELGTMDYFPINLVMGAAVGLAMGLLLYAVLLIPFFLTFALLRRFKSPRLWLCGPSGLALIILLAKAVWGCLPDQRLEHVAQRKLEGATEIRVTGFTGLTAAEWVAVCRIDEASFLSYCRDQKLQSEEHINVMERLKHRSFAKSVKWVVALPDLADPVQFSRFDKANPLEGFFALYDRKSMTMVLFGFRS